MRKEPFINEQFYHIYNRGVDKRNIFEDQCDMQRFFQSMNEFNVIEPIGSIYAASFKKNIKFGHSTSKFNDLDNRLVNFICFCLNKNHYHFLLEQVTDNGISEFMKRLGGGYTKHFNEKYKRSGSLFQGRFKSSRIDSDKYLRHISVYINLNDRIHNKNQLRRPTSKLSKSSWDEYVKNGNSFNEILCKKDVILDQFKDNKEYKNFAADSLKWIIENKEKNKELKNSLLE